MTIFVAGYVTYVSLHVKDEKTVSISNHMHATMLLINQIANYGAS